MANAFHNLNANQKSSLALIAIIGLLVLPVTIWSVQKENRSRSKASLTPVSVPITSPITIPSDPCAPNSNRVTYLYPVDQPGCHDLQYAIDLVPDYTYGHQIIMAPGYYSPAPSNNLFALEIRNKINLFIGGHYNFARHAVKLDFNGNRGGLAIHNSSVTLGNMNLYGNVVNGLLYATDNDYLTLQEVIIKSDNANAVVVSNANNLRVERVKFTASSVCLYPQNISRMSISYSHFYRCGKGISAINSSGYIFYNLFEHSSETDISLYSTPSVAIKANTFYDTSSYTYKFALIYDTNQSTVDILDIERNNIVSGANGIKFSPVTVPDYIFTHNNVFVAQTAYVGLPNHTGIKTNTSVDPLFGDHDYCLPIYSSLNYPDGPLGHYGACNKFNWERDINSDGKVNLIDLNVVYKRFGRPDYDYRSVDLDEDDDVDTIDLHYFLRYLSP
jgi:hypothetical protein